MEEKQVFVKKSFVFFKYFLVMSALLTKEKKKEIYKKYNAKNKITEVLTREVVHCILKSGLIWKYFRTCFWQQLLQMTPYTTFQ